ncbi:Rep [Bat associated cyclovirus 6]|uniref:Replication-associated protein n=1 Tax=Bat associated cyclovirus 6 TaxID=1987731 RepID=A0A0D3MDD2_9CIRC|nr:Rep [Bat associated cyclovirus 6]AIF76249.1 Rep [Bat associated cyclovirus 6]
MSRTSVRRFCFTWNDYTLEDCATVEKFITEYCKYGIAGEEFAPTTNQPHIQGFCSLHKPMRFSTIKKRLHNTIHIEKANGSDEQNQTYCRKSGAYFEKGTPCFQGQRSDLRAVVSAIQSGKNAAQVAKEYPLEYIRYFRGIQELDLITNAKPPRFYKTWVYYYWGPPGSGKSKRALQEAQSLDEEIYYKPRGKWWDGYNGQDCVIIDDFYGWIKYDELLKITDRYPYKVQVKGGFREFTSRRIWFTSNVDTHELYKFIGYNNTAFERRITCKINIV